MGSWGHDARRRRRREPATDPDPEGGRAARRAYNRSLPKTVQREARVVFERSHMWHEETGICVVHQKPCPRPQ